MWILTNGWPNLQEVNNWGYHAAKVNSAAFTPNGRLMATCSIDSYVHIWDIEAGYIIHKIKGMRYVRSLLESGGVAVWAVRNLSLNPMRNESHYTFFFRHVFGLIVPRLNSSYDFHLSMLLE